MGRINLGPRKKDVLRIQATLLLIVLLIFLGNLAMTTPAEGQFYPVSPLFSPPLFPVFSTSWTSWGSGVPNFLGRLSGIATLTAQCVQAVEGTRARILDTRKTTPGLRGLEKEAVRLGGGHNHRFGLNDGVLIKDNHIKAAGGVARSIEAARSHAPHLLKIEVECETMPEVREALLSGADVILLDNMDIDTMRSAVELTRRVSPNVLIEASGSIGVNPTRLQAVASTGVDFISLGALTHSAPNFDVSLEFE